MQMIVIDFKQTFHQVERKQLMKDLKNIEIPKKLRELLKITIEESNTVINTGQGPAEKIPVQNRMRQRDSLSTICYYSSLQH